MDFCRNCRSEVDPDAVVCLNCGLHPLKKENYCNRCGNETIEDQELCLKCGRKISRLEDTIVKTDPVPQFIINNSNNNQVENSSSNVNTNINRNETSGNSSGVGCWVFIFYFLALVLPYVFLPVGIYWILKPNPNLKNHGIALVVISSLVLLGLFGTGNFPGFILLISLIVSAIIFFVFKKKKNEQNEQDD